MVGTVVLPILGAVPDGAIVLFSGLGDDAQNQIAVGVGALAGSTIMLLTIPWFLTIYAGRVGMKGSKCDYNHPGPKCPSSPSLTHALFETAVEVKDAVRENANYMLGTGVSYLFLQLVLFFDDKGSHGMKDKDDEDSLDNLKKAQRYVALATMCVCFVFFSAYLYQMITRSPEKKSNDAAHLVAEAKFMKRLKLCIAKGDVSIMSALFEDLNSSSTGDNLKTPLRGGDSNMTKRLIKICKPVFNRYDLDRSSTLSKNELHFFFKDLGIGSAEMLACRDKIDELDRDKNGKVTLEELCEWIPSFAKFVSTSAYLDRLADVKKELKSKTNELRRNRTWNLEHSLTRFCSNFNSTHRYTPANAEAIPLGTIEKLTEPLDLTSMTNLWERVPDADGFGQPGIDHNYVIERSSEGDDSLVRVVFGKYSWFLGARKIREEFRSIF